MKAIITSIALIALISTAHADPALNQGKAAYTVCASCHGAQGEGNKTLNSPAIAGQEDWYLIRQLKNFKAGIRGTHAQDTYGAQMRPMSMTLANDAAIENVVRYIKTFPTPKAEDASKLSGDAAKGAKLYITCTACHGAKAEGNKMMNGPNLTHLPSWYITRQLKNFKAGIRGTHPQDTYGAQMRPMSMTLADDAAIADVIRYMKSLR